MHFLFLFIFSIITAFGYELIPNSEALLSQFPVLRTDGKGNSLAFWGTKYSFCTVNGDFITSDTLADSSATGSFFNACFDSNQNLLLVWKNGNELKYTYKKAEEITQTSEIKTSNLGFKPNSSVIRYSSYTNKFYLQIVGFNQQVYFLDLLSDLGANFSQPLFLFDSSDVPDIQETNVWFDIDEKGNALFVGLTKTGGSYENGKILLYYLDAISGIGSSKTISLGADAGANNLFVFYNENTPTAYWLIAYRYNSSSGGSFRGFIANQDLSFISDQRIISEGFTVALAKKSDNQMVFMKQERNKIYYSFFKPSSLAEGSLNLSYRTIPGSNLIPPGPRSCFYNKNGRLYFTFINDPATNPNIAYAYLGPRRYSFSGYIKNLGPTLFEYQSIVGLSNFSSTSRIIWIGEADGVNFKGIYTTKAFYPLAAGPSGISIQKGVR